MARAGLIAGSKQSGPEMSLCNQFKKTCSMKAARCREIWVDTAKGAAIVLVVIGHAWRGLEAAGLLLDLPPGVFAAIDQRIYAFHMPLFFLLSGLFLQQSLCVRPVADYVGSRLLRLFWPMLLWTYVFAAVKVLAGTLANSPIGVEEALHSPIPGRWHFWFLWALFLLHLGLLTLRPLLCRVRLRRPVLWLLLGASLALQVAPFTHAVHAWTSNALRFLPYLALGLLLTELGSDRLRAERLGPAWLALFVGTLSLVPWLGDLGVPVVLTASVLCLSAVASTIWMAQRQPQAASALAFLGMFSMIIFLSHTIFSAALREILLAAGIANIPLHMALATLAGIALPVLLQQGLARVASPRLIGA